MSRLCEYCRSPSINEWPDSGISWMSQLSLHYRYSSLPSILTAALYHAEAVNHDMCRTTPSRYEFRLTMLQNSTASCNKRQGCTRYQLSVRRENWCITWDKDMSLQCIHALPYSWLLEDHLATNMQPGASFGLLDALFVHFHYDSNDNGIRKHIIVRAHDPWREK